MAAKGRRLRPDDALVVALASGRSSAAAAAVTGLAERTITRRMADPAFVARVGEARSRLASNALARLAGSLAAAVDAMVGLLTSPLAADSVKLGAARSILEQFTRLAESVENRKRLDELESLLKRCKEPDAKPS